MKPESQSVICEKCQGSGKFEIYVCPNCGGKGKVLWINNIVKENRNGYEMITEISMFVNGARSTKSFKKGYKCIRDYLRGLKKCKLIYEFEMIDDRPLLTINLVLTPFDKQKVGMSVILV